MEPVIRMKNNLLKGVGRMLAPDEEVLMAVTYGKKRLEEGVEVRAHEVNYLLLTDHRVIDVKGRFFRDGTGFCAYPRRLVTGADARHYLAGSTVKVNFCNECKAGEEVEVVFTDCDRQDADALAKTLSDQLETRRCPMCMKKLIQDHTFCPFCGGRLKTICPRCGKPRQGDAAVCPNCGG